MRTLVQKTVRALVPVMIGAVFVLTAETVTDALTHLAQATPHVGDILSFPASHDELSANDATRLIVHRADASGCVLDLNAIRQTGGSLVVESEVATTANGFRVHWAGERTTAGAGNCGANADLVVDSRELKLLALGATGYAERDFAPVGDPLALGEVAN